MEKKIKIYHLHIFIFSYCLKQNTLFFSLNIQNSCNFRMDSQNSKQGTIVRSYNLDTQKNLLDTIFQIGSLEWSWTPKFLVKTKEDWDWTLNRTHLGLNTELDLLAISIWGNLTAQPFKVLKRILIFQVTRT